MFVKSMSSFPDQFSILLIESISEKFNFLVKMSRDWESGANRFDKTGEVLFALFEKEELIGVGGLNIDPYAQDSKIGRIRHLYILRKYRKLGAGKLMVDHLLVRAKSHFSKVRLKTDTEAAAKFYERLGFVAVVDSSASHEIVF